MVKTVKPDLFAKALTNIIEEFSVKTQHKTNLIVKRAAIDIWGGVIKSTPVDQGRARGNWQVKTQDNDSVLGKQKNKGVSYVTSNLPKNILSQKVYLFNNLPYINMLEYGGWPKNPKTGSKTVNGYSRQAPRGMLRKNLIRWKSALRKAAKRTA